LISLLDEEEELDTDESDEELPDDKLEDDELLIMVSLGYVMLPLYFGTGGFQPFPPFLLCHYAGNARRA
jgi:hypothetical protein